MRGDAMQHRRICDGALLVIERRLIFSHGQIVLAWCDGEWLLRELAQYESGAALIGGPAWPVIELSDDVRVVGLLRWTINSHCGLRIADLPVVE